MSAHVKPKLTSKNLFDVIFSSIPADASIDCGPASLLEEIAFSADTQGTTAIKGLMDDDDDDGIDGVPSHTRPQSGSAGGGATWTRMQAEGTSTPSYMSPSSSVGMQMKVEIDTDDDAVREATKHAAYLSELRDEKAATDEVARARRTELQAGYVAAMRAGTQGARDEKLVSASSHDAGDAKDSKGGDRGDGTTLKATRNGGRGAAGSARPHLSAEEQLTMMPPGLSTTYSGRCVMLRQSKGFGFIAPDLGGPDVYFIRDSIATTFTRLVLNAYYTNNKKPIPQSVQLIEKKSLVLGTSPQDEAPHPSGEDEAHGGDNSSGGAPPVADSSSAAEAEAESEGSSGFVFAEYADQPVPLITTVEQERAAEAAAHVSQENAALLQHFIESGRGGAVAVRDVITFTVQRNRTLGNNSRLLRAEYIRGAPEQAYAMPAEQAWFWPLFPSAVGIKSEYLSEGQVPPAPGGTETGAEHGEANANADGASAGKKLLERYSGTVRMFEPEERRGYIRCDESGAPDVIFYADSFVWHTDVPPAQRQVQENMRVRYSVAGRERNNKYLATLITSEKDTPFDSLNVVIVEDAKGWGGKGGVGGSAGDGDGHGGHKRAREEGEQLLLLEEDDYAMI